MKNFGELALVSTVVGMLAGCGDIYIGEPDADGTGGTGGGAEAGDTGTDDAAPSDSTSSATSGTSPGGTSGAADTSGGDSGAGGGDDSGDAGADSTSSDPGSSDSASEAGDSGSAAVSFETDVFPILDGTCNGSSCHDANSPQANLDLSNAAVGYGELLDGFVVPGSLNASEFWNQVSTGQMPRGAPDLSEAELSTIETWILEGAEQ